MYYIQNDPMMNEFEIVVLLEHVWIYAGKKKILGEKEEIMNLGGRGSVETYI